LKTIYTYPPTDIIIQFKLTAQFVYIITSLFTLEQNKGSLCSLLFFSVGIIRVKLWTAITAKRLWKIFKDLQFGSAHLLTLHLHFIQISTTLWTLCTRWISLKRIFFPLTGQWAKVFLLIRHSTWWSCKWKKICVLDLPVPDRDGKNR